jgi:serine/threonine protein kinase/tetratricopeptide (TPR) repeat protein
MPLAPGDRLGPYEIVSLVGSGGMGEIYKARDTRLDRTVALKILTSGHAADPRFRERFDREARAISKLDHPHICALYDVGVHEGNAYLVMQYLEGQTLAARLREGELLVDEALKCAVEIVDALAAAHRAGITHRDLKPANIMLTKSGAKLLDFGIAKLRPPAVTAATPGSNAVTNPTSLTVPGLIVGTLHYMSPEQLMGLEGDSRSDIFAIGAVLYETLTGRKAFDGESQASVIVSILERDLPRSNGHALAPPALDRLVRKCLAKDPDERWQTAKDLGDELRWVRESCSSAIAPNSGVQREVSTRPSGGGRVDRRRRFIFRFTIGISLLVILTTFASVRRAARQPVQTVTRVEMPPLPPEPPASRLPTPQATADSIAGQRVLDARSRMEAGDYSGALVNLNAVIDANPDNTEARNLKQEAEVAAAARARASTSERAKAVRVTSPEAEADTRAETAVPGIPRRAGELAGDYTARVRRLQVAFSEGKSSLDNQDYATALDRFRTVAREQPGYPGVDRLISDSAAAQSREFDQAMSGGQGNEQAGRLRDARMWYQRAMRVDPSSTRAREKEASLKGRMNLDALNLFDQANNAEKTQDTDKAIRLYQQIVDQMLPGDDLRERAAQRLSALKQ